MSLQEKLVADMKEAMKAKEVVRLAVIRMIRAELQKAEITKAAALTEADELDVLARSAKQRRESIEAFANAGRTELADKERAELAVFETYLPAPLSPAEVEALAKEVIAAVGASSKKDLSKVMGQLMPQLKGRFPGKDVGPIVQRLLP